jgi:hypothetical protein
MEIETIIAPVTPWPMEERVALGIAAGVSIAPDDAMVQR